MTGSLNNVCDIIGGLTPIKGVLVSKAVFNIVRECDVWMEGFGDARKEGWYMKEER